MAFRFALDPVLRLRRSLEHQQQQLLHEANQQLNALLQKIESLNLQLTRLSQLEASALVATTTAAELQFVGLGRSVLLEQRSQVEKQLSNAQEVRNARLAAFRQARQQREVIETLREGQLKEWLVNESHQMQRQLDDALLLRRAFLRRR